MLPTRVSELPLPTQAAVNVSSLIIPKAMRLDKGLKQKNLGLAGKKASPFCIYGKVAG